MDRARIKTLVESILRREKESSKLLLSPQDVVSAPYCSLDLETYGLLRQRIEGTRIAQSISDMVRVAKRSLSEPQLAEAITLVTRKRSRGNTKYFRCRIGRGELEILNVMSASMKTKPARILEAVMFLMVRIEPEASHSNS